jgi:hypothetical protein
MALEMKSDCERCQFRLSPQVEAYICSFECTFCPECAKALDATCPNCGGELVRRPRQKATPPLDPLNGNPTEAASIITECRVVS